MDSFAFVYFDLLSFNPSMIESSASGFVDAANRVKLPGVTSGSCYVFEVVGGVRNVTLNFCSACFTWFLFYYYTFLSSYSLDEDELSQTSVFFLLSISSFLLIGGAISKFFVALFVGLVNDALVEAAGLFELLVLPCTCSDYSGCLDSSDIDYYLGVTVITTSAFSYLDSS